jgi:hypothetical protein
LAIIFWNRLDPNKPIHPGDELIIYKKGLRPGEIDEDEEKAETGPGGSN